MHTEYYSYPLDLKRVFQNQPLQKCDQAKAIAQNLQLIIVSHNGAHRYNPSLGCEIWDMDFDLIMSLRIWEEKLRTSLLKSIAENEPSIEQTDIDVKVSEIEQQGFGTDYVAIKRKVDISVNAILSETGETYYFHTQLFLSPVSYH